MTLFDKGLITIASALSLILLSSCAQEIVEPSQRIEGKYVKDDGTMLASEYLEFKDGSAYLYSYEGPDLTFAENCFWASKSSDFEKVWRKNYEIRSGKLTIGQEYLGEVKLEEDVLKIDGLIYSRLVGINNDYYSRITLEKANESFSYNAQEVRIGIPIINPLPKGELSAEIDNLVSADWIQDLHIKDTTIVFSLTETKTTRSAQIRLSYTNASSVAMTVWQEPKTFIVLESLDYNVDYKPQKVVVPYSIDNPVEGSSLTISTEYDWVKNIIVGTDSFTFDIEENNSGADRTAIITLSYAGARDVTLGVFQKWSAPGIVLSPTSQTMDYHGGTFQFDVTVNNPREGITLSSSSLADWITITKYSGNTLTYKVPENNSGNSRTGKIRLTYGSYSAVFEIQQSWASSQIVCTPASQSIDYRGGSCQFEIAVENPREGAFLSSASLADWILITGYSGNTLSYKVSENNSRLYRTGKIKLSYGNYAETEFSVNQSGKPVQSLSLDKTSLSLHPGNTETLSVIVDPGDAVLQWSSSSASVVSVDQYGNVTANGNGNAVITVSSTDGSGKNAACSVMVTTLVTAITLNKTSLSLDEGESESLIATIAPSTASDKSLAWNSSDETIAVVDKNGRVTSKTIGKTTITATANDGSGIMASCAVSVCPIGSVDLGLSVYWAACNLSESGFVSSPEEYGDYYAWGETAPYYSNQDPLTWKTDKTGYNWASYSLCKGSSYTLTRYNINAYYGTVDNKTEFKDYNYEDDAARQVLGGKWRIPTDAEWTELRGQCTWKWTTKNGVNGRLVTSKINGNKIFLPAAGYRGGTSLDRVGSCGYYWSSSLYTGNPNDAWDVYFDSDDVHRTFNGYRYGGFSVRPVTE
ncbi:MAG: Ig-like domain-containing protein [Bacteroidales bacterium]|nr:Ig-like domain-containing protein [Bacteroidales bacterium]